MAFLTDCRRVRGQLLSTVISDCTPKFCTVYVVSKGKLEALRPSNGEANDHIVEYDSTATNSTNSSSRYTNSTLGNFTYNLNIYFVSAGKRCDLELFIDESVSIFLCILKE